jgi:hypothetical protein
MMMNLVQVPDLRLTAWALWHSLCSRLINRYVRPLSDTAMMPQVGGVHILTEALTIDGTLRLTTKPGGTHLSAFDKYPMG